jgi:hypothetical protein
LGARLIRFFDILAINKREISKIIFEKSKKGRMANALALRGEEGRDKLRKAAGRSKYPLYPRISEWGNPSR